MLDSYVYLNSDKNLIKNSKPEKDTGGIYICDDDISWHTMLCTAQYIDQRLKVFGTQYHSVMILVNQLFKLLNLKRNVWPKDRQFTINDLKRGSSLWNLWTLTSRVRIISDFFKHAIIFLRLNDSRRSRNPEDWKFSHQIPFKKYMLWEVFSARLYISPIGVYKVLKQTLSQMNWRTTNYNSRRKPLWVPGSNCNWRWHLLLIDSRSRFSKFPFFHSTHWGLLHRIIS